MGNAEAESMGDPFPKWNSVVAVRGGLVVDFDEAARGANGIDVALREYRAEPGFQRAAAVEITEERAVFGLAG